MEKELTIESYGDNIFPDVPLGEKEIFERKGMLKYSSYFTKEQITAFTLSMKSLYLLYNQRIQEARDLSMKALLYDITSIDSFQILIQDASFFIDIETKICLYLQLVSLYKTRYLKKVVNISTPKILKNRIERRKIQSKTDNIKEPKNINNDNKSLNRNFTKVDLQNLIFNDNEIQSADQELIQIILQPYFRLLFSLGETAFLGDNPVLSMQCYEEVLRFDSKNQFAASNLVVSYVKIIGMRQRGVSPLPKRTMWHLKILLDVYDMILDEEVRFCGKLVLSYFFRNEIAQSKDDENEFNLQFENDGYIYDSRDCWEGLNEWSEITKDFHKNCPKAVSFIFMEKQGKSEYPLITAFQEWIDLVVDMHQVLYGESESFYKFIHEKNKNSDSFRTFRTSKRVMAKAGNEHLEKARASLRNQNYIDAINECTLSKKMFTEANYPSYKFYLNSPFPVLSNRAVACYHLELWVVVMHDVRFTLMMNPKHQKSYVLMKRVALVFGCTSLVELMNKLIQKVNENELSDKEWICCAKKAIALLSLEAFALSKEGKLDEDSIEHLMKVGIEDCFCELPCSTIFVPHLPWINE